MVGLGLWLHESSLVVGKSKRGTTTNVNNRVKAADKRYILTALKAREADVYIGQVSFAGGSGPQFVYQPAPVRRQRTYPIIALHSKLGIISDMQVEIDVWSEREAGDKY